MDEDIILLKAAELFTKYGIKSMTMDDVSRHMGISKKTLYQFVSNKKELVYKAINSHISQEQCGIEDFMAPLDGNAIDELMTLTRMIGSEMKEMHPSVIFDLKKYYPEAFSVLIKHRDDFITASIKNNLKKGVESGLYRDNINAEIVTELYISMINLILDPEKETLAKFTNSEIHTELMRYHIRGIASNEGRTYLKEKFKQENV